MTMTRSQAGKLGGAISGKLSAERSQNRIAEYDLSPTECAECQKALAYAKRDNKFCNNSCAATYNNQRKIANVNTKEYACLACDTINKHRGVNFRNMFCNNKCQQEHAYRDRIAKWKITGEIGSGTLKKYLATQKHATTNPIANSLTTRTILTSRKRMLERGGPLPVHYSPIRKWVSTLSCTAQPFLLIFAVEGSTIF